MPRAGSSGGASGVRGDPTTHDAQIRQGLAPAGRLPEPVRRCVERAIPLDGPVPTRVRVEQTGDMWPAPGSKPMHFTAVEEFAGYEAAFSWHARFPILPLLAMRIQDGLEAGEGRMRGRFAGIPFMDKSGPALTIGAAMRYLAEIPWVPYAMLANHRLHWRQVDDITAEVSTDTLFGRAAVSIEFDAVGDIVRAYSDARPRDGDVARPWGGFYSDYAAVGGVRVPTTAEVRWELPEGPFTYRRGEITALALIDAAGMT